MPDVVLRHPKLKGQPIVVHASLDGLVDTSYQAAGWEIDADTSPVDAEAESLATAEAAQSKAVKFSPKFAPAVESASTTGGSASTKKENN